MTDRPADGPPRPDPFTLTVIAPFYNEGADNIGRFYEAVAPVLERVAPRWELVVIDDGSADDTLETLKALHRRDDRVRVIGLSRNYGHQTALTAGLHEARGDAVVVMDGDLQDPPEVIEAMLGRWREGVDVVYAMRRRRDGEFWGKRLASATFYRLLRVISDQKIPLDTGDFRLMDRAVVDGLNAFPERNRFLRGIVSWMGFRQEALPFDRAPRVGGEPKYTLRKLMALAANGIFSFSRKPLRIATWIGLLCSLVAFGYMGWVIVRGVFYRSEDVSGWYSLITVVLFLGGLQLTCLGLIGEYVGRIYEEVKARPLYLVRERLGFVAGGPGTGLGPLPPAQARAAAAAASGRFTVADGGGAGLLEATLEPESEPESEPEPEPEKTEPAKSEATATDDA